MKINIDFFGKKAQLEISALKQDLLIKDKKYNDLVDSCEYVLEKINSGLSNASISALQALQNSLDELKGTAINYPFN